jgi:hypothetical protein
MRLIDNTLGVQFQVWSSSSFFKSYHAEIEIDKIYSDPDEIEVTYFSTPRPSLDNYETSSKDQRLETLSEACFRKTWYIR